MFNKKVGLLVLASMGLVACGGGQSSQTQSSAGSSPAQSSQQGPSIPTADGKVTLYFLFTDTETAKLADMPSYCSPFITGNWSGYATTPDKASEMVRLEGTNYFYAQIAAGLDMGDLGYQITIGYNAASNVGTDKQGIDWNYKTTYSTENFPGLDHPVLTKLADNLYEAKAGDVSGLGFAAYKPAPEIVKNPSLKFKIELQIDEVFGDNLEYVIKGDFNGWTPTALGAPDDEGYYTVELGEEVIVGKYEYCVGVHNKFIGGQDDRYNLMMADLTEEEEESLDVIGGDVEEEVDPDTGSVTAYNVTNFAISLNKIYGDDYAYDGGRLTNPTYASGTREEYKLPSNEAPKMEHGMIIRLTNSEDAVGIDDFAPYVAGDIVKSDWSERVEMVEKEEGVTWEAYIEPLETDVVGVTHNFKITVAEGWTGWQIALAPSEAGGDLQNVSYELDNGVGVVELVADLKNIPENNKIVATLAEKPAPVALDFPIEVHVKNTGEGEPSVVSIPGTWNGWSHDLKLTKSATEEDVYVAVIPHGTLNHADEVKFKLADGTWDHSIGMNGSDAVVYVDYLLNVINLEGDIVNFTGDVKFVSAAFPIPAV